MSGRLSPPPSRNLACVSIEFFYYYMLARLLDTIQLECCMCIISPSPPPSSRFSVFFLLPLFPSRRISSSALSKASLPASTLPQLYQMNRESGIGRESKQAGCQFVKVKSVFIDELSRQKEISSITVASYYNDRLSLSLSLHTKALLSPDLFFPANSAAVTCALRSDYCRIYILKLVRTVCRQKQDQSSCSCKHHPSMDSYECSCAHSTSPRVILAVISLPVSITV